MKGSVRDDREFSDVVADWPDDPWDTPEVLLETEVEPPRRDRRLFKWLAFGLIALLLGAVLAAGAVAWWVLRQVNPPGEVGKSVTFTVNEGDTADSIAARLQADGIITSARVFGWYIDRRGGLELQPGYYTLKVRDDMGNVASALETPPELTYTKVTFPEGFTVAQMDRRLHDKVPRMPSGELTRALRSGEVTSSFLPPGQTSFEGLLFPDTYQVAGNETAVKVAKRMANLMERVAAKEEMDEKAAQLDRTPYEILTIASMIEREAKFDDERAKIARVIYNRLFLGGPLQIDATLYYGVPGAADIPFDELRQMDTPYNTYLHEGLPPTPIANPGRASIRAALNPAPDSAGKPLLFYVKIDKEGRHAFASTYEEHLANIEKAKAAGALP